VFLVGIEVMVCRAEMEVGEMVPIGDGLEKG